MDFPFCILFCPIFSIVLWSLHTFCQEIYWHFPTPSRNNYTSIALTILNNRIIWSDFLQSAQIKVIWIQSVISVCSWCYALPYIFRYFPFFFFTPELWEDFFLLDAIAWFACLLFWFNSFGLVAAHWFGTHQFTCWNTSPAPLHWSLCFSTSKAESSRVNRLNEKKYGNGMGKRVSSDCRRSFCL